jgi:outer membrane protein assembly factor BamB
MRALDGAGNAVAAGFLTQAGFDSAFAVVELAGSDGSERWRHLISESTAGQDEALGVAVDHDGDVVVLGIVRVPTPERFRREFTVVKLVGAEGTLRWRRDVTANQFGGDPRALVLDATDDVVVAGATLDALGSHGDVIKLAGVDGSEQWRARDDAVSADRLDVNDAGDVVVAGVRFDPQSRFDIVVRKLLGTTGAESWHTARNGSGTGDDVAVALAVDAGADVAVLGELVGATTAADFAVIKLRGGDGADF